MRFLSIVLALLYVTESLCSIVEFSDPRTRCGDPLSRRRNSANSRLSMSPGRAFRGFMWDGDCVDIDDTAVDGRNDYDELPNSRKSVPNNAKYDVLSTRLTSRVNMWPPWPLNLITRERQSNDDDSTPTAANTYPSAAALFWAYFQQRARVTVRQIQEVGSQLWFHLPPAAPPFILLASIPRKISVVENKEAGIVLSKQIVPILSNPFARNLALSGLGLAVISWAHMEVNRKKRLTPLSLTVPYRSVSRAILPPYLPEHVPEPVPLFIPLQ